MKGPPTHPPSVTVWSTGTPLREFIYGGDMAAACVFLIDLPDNRLRAVLGRDKKHSGRLAPLLNKFGADAELSVKELAEQIQCAVSQAASLVI